MKEEVGYRARKRVIQQLTSRRRSDQFTRLQSADWDILIILDACRTDILQQAAGWPVDSAISPASCTPQWLQAVSSDSLFEGTHIISGNPQYEKVDANISYETLEPFWKNHWDSTLQTVPPEPILDRVDDIVEESSHSIVAHLQQPHWPYIAKLGNEWMLAYDDLGPWTLDSEEITSVQVAMQRGVIDIAKAKQAYDASIRSVWHTLTEYLPDWINSEYRVIVTADHGEMFGLLREFGFYEHPCSCHLAPLINVPWIELTPREETQTADKVEDRLRALGYAE
ncbi:hypothetical protein KM295_16000 [Natronomonas sp. F2-12]|jgi:hypothetical protein|uniref:Uncharacterized protein n=1 Tax=Natronomonas aquatica TaxID=2841590 RepID=A0A9R1CW42_9EURY|nr:hypothetical protein [Natronomonas aquatica]MCQ4334955.1 hypothetical protein [Natronomonas aquatica]